MALAFCRECMGWEDAAPVLYGTTEKQIPTLLINGIYWHFTDLTSVFSVVRTWCEANGLGWSMESEGERVRVMVLGEYREVGVTGEDVCGVMMEACVGWVRGVAGEE